MKFDGVVVMVVPEQVMLLDWVGPELTQVAAVQLGVSCKAICMRVPLQEDPE